jgi:glycosyltransferase involved in cell wall biosynthesis
MGNVYPTPHWNSTMPNKVFDYMAAGVPTVAINAKETGDFITKHDIGISVDSLEELKDRWGEERKCRKNLIKKRQQFVMDNHISKLEDLYRQFV